MASGKITNREVFSQVQKIRYIYMGSNNKIHTVYELTSDSLVELLLETSDYGIKYYVTQDGGTTWIPVFNIPNDKTKSGTESSGLVTFASAFADTNYSVSLCPVNNNSSLVWSCAVISKSTTGFTYQCKYLSDASTNTWTDFNQDISWIAVHN